MGIFNDLTKKVYKELDQQEIEPIQSNDAADMLKAIDSSLATIEFDTSGNILSANQNFLNTVGYNLSEIQGNHHSMFVTPEYKSSPEYQQFWENLRKGISDVGEYLRIGKGGKEVWIQASYNAIVDSQGTVTKVVKIATDITQQKLLAVFEAENAKVKSALDVATSSVMMADENNVIVYMNDSVNQMLRDAESDIRQDLGSFSTDNVLGSNIDIFHKNPAHQREMLKALRNTFKTEISIGPRTFSLVANPVFGADEKRQGTVVEWHDVTETLARKEQERLRVVAERKTAAENSRVKSALDTVSSNVMMADADNVIIYANDAVMNMLRVAESDLRKVLPAFDSAKIMGSNIDIFHKNPAHQRSMLSALKTEYKTEITVGVRTFSLIANPVFDDDQNRQGTVVEWKDRTEELSFENKLNDFIESAVSGEINSRVNTEGSAGFITKIGSGINKLMDVFQNVLEEIAVSATTVKEGSLEISSGNTNLSQRTEEQAASLEETSAAMEEITTTVQQNAANSSQANTLARTARETAENGGIVVSQAVTAMQAINESSNKINDIIGVIDEIAFQTNLLALNAAVEAARAGDQGRGFAVVADEVRSLAGRSATAAKEIKGLIKDSGEKVKEGSDLVNKSGDTLEDIVTAVKKVNDIVAEISTASDEQATGLDEINKAIGEMDEMTQQNAALVEEAAAASEAMGNQAENLDSLVSFFNLNSATKGKQQSRQTPVGKSAASASAAPAPRSKPAPKVKPASTDDDDWSEF